MFRTRVVIRAATLAVAASIAVPGAQAFAAEPPTVTKVEPKTGPAVGGTSVAITGTGFNGASAVKFGSTAATRFTVNSETSITAVSPLGVPGYPTGLVNVTVTTPAGTSEHKIAGVGEFGYDPIITGIEPNTGPAAGGTRVTIHGEGFAEPPQPPPPFAPHGPDCVTFGSSPCVATVEVFSNTLMIAVAPAGTGTVDVRVKNLEGGTSATSAGDLFGYGETPPPAPTVAKVEPNHGPTAGGTTVTITGTNLSETGTVEFGSQLVLNFTVNSATSITAVSPGGSPGETDDVTVITPRGISATGPADRFTFDPPATVPPIKRFPKFFNNGVKDKTLHKPVITYGPIRLHNAVLGNLECQNMFAGVTYNETTEGTEKGLTNTTGYGTFNCVAAAPCKVKNTKGEEVEGIYLTAESPPEPVSATEAHPTGITSLPWTGELIERETGIQQVLTQHAKIWEVLPPETVGKGANCQGVEVPFEEKEGPTEKEAGYELAPTWTNGIVNALKPSHNEFNGENGQTEKGFPQTGRLKSPVGDGFLTASKLYNGGLSGGWELVNAE